MNSVDSPSLPILGESAEFIIGSNWEMPKLNYCEGKCTYCNSGECINTSSENGTEFQVCKKCGNVIVGRSFDTLRFLIDQIHDGITNEETLVGLLCDTLNDVYYWVDEVDNETLARLLINELYLEATLTAEAEDEEAVEYERERVEAMAGRY